ncbi:hypothetical protein J3Q64DRAFT_1746982 [Phycomyces blakesleeanus]|uniref:Uncharacterized protein n=1 Tax=Phycomyces blakesleeanus TaxID=4837 RepID=A0ABR3AWJ0_PHYBL
MLFQKTILASLFAVLAFASATSATVAPFSLSKRDCEYTCPDNSCNDKCQAASDGRAVAPICQGDTCYCGFSP